MDNPMLYAIYVKGRISTIRWKLQDKLNHDTKRLETETQLNSSSKHKPWWSCLLDGSPSVESSMIVSDLCFNL